MVRIILFTLFLFSYHTLLAQVFETDRITDWSKAGNSAKLPESTVQINVLDFGADNTGVTSCNAAYNSAIESLSGGAGIIYFPEGEYYFDAAVAIPDSVLLKGESSASLLRFNLGGSGNLIVMNGGISTVEHTLAATATKGSYELELVDATDFEVGDVLRLGCFDEDLMYSTWAYGTLGQVLIITEKEGNVVRFDDPLNHHYPLSRNPSVRKINPRKAAGISCLSIEREDATESQTSNIYIGYAVNCFITNVKSENCNFAHIEVNSSAHVTIEGSYFHDAFAYGGGGQGYGVVFQATSSFNLAQNNIFNHLRHSMLLQSGANGNVFAYNYSHNPYWDEGSLPGNAAGDAVLHGNYVFQNLFEGNTVQNIVVDASHGSNGPYNTFFRNRAELYGFFSDFSTTTDSMNVVGNEITNSGFPLGLFAVNGVGHYAYGNNVSGTTNPANSSDVQTNSLYLNEQELPPFLEGETLPMIGYPLAIDEKLLPAEVRFLNQTYVNCNASVVTSLNALTNPKETVTVVDDQLIVPSSLLPATIRIYNTSGQLCEVFNASRTRYKLPRLAPGIHIIQTIGRKEMNNIKVLISR